MSKNERGYESMVGGREEGSKHTFMQESGKLGKIEVKDIVTVNRSARPPAGRLWDLIPALEFVLLNSGIAGRIG